MAKRCKANVDRLRGYKIKLYPTEEQKERLNRTIDLYRYVYNKGKAIQDENYQNGGKYISFFSMCKIFSDMRNGDEYPWLKEISANTMREALLDLDGAYQKFFLKATNYPKFKSKKTSPKSFTSDSNITHSKDNCVIIGGFNGEKFNAGNHNMPIGVRLYGTTVSFDGYDYWFSCQVEKDYVDMSDTPVSEPLGIDLGVRNIATLSDGTVYNFPDMSKLEKRKRRKQRKVQKDINRLIKISQQTKTKFEDLPKSKNMIKRAKDLRKAYNKVTNIKHTFIHTMTKQIVDKNPSVIVLENLRVNSMMMNDNLSSQVKNQIMFYEIRRQIEYKAADRQIPVIIADTWYPSSKLCSNCGHKHDKLGDKHIYKCPVCGFEIDRDLNAAYNLRNLAIIVPITYEDNTTSIVPIYYE